MAESLISDFTKHIETADNQNIASHRLELVFLWHMHQPDYRDKNGVMKMPWVFLHALKDYYDMPWIVSRTSEIKVTFNLTPTLILQLQKYADPLQNDRFLELWIKDYSLLNSDEKKYLMKYCKASNFETMVKPLKHFARLYNKSRYDAQEFVDIEVLSVLSWCGNYLRRNNDIVKELIKKGKNFTYDDKRRLLESLKAFVKTILPYYKTLYSKGKIGLSTTPFAHPILPLLMDINSAKAANSYTILPANPISLKGDALMHIKRSEDQFTKIFGTKPIGIWPAEGAVDEKTIALYQERNIRWAASDETILFKSIDSSERENLYKPYRSGSCMLFFRDRKLSDLIGFSYRFVEPKKAANHFVGQLESIYKTGKDALVCCILDGENAWEFYENNGYNFLTELYGKLGKLEWARIVRFEDIPLDRCVNIEKLSTGSWINGDFSTWIGSSEKNRAWELLFQAKRDFLHYRSGLLRDQTDAVENHFLSAECSDWFWWYGDDHSTAFDMEFDQLFREHLIDIYNIMRIPAPNDLFIPIAKGKSTAYYISKPKFSITPIIDGRFSSFFEWLGAGCVDETAAFSTMDTARGPIKKIYYGYDDKSVYIALEGNIASLIDNGSFVNILFQESDEIVRVPISSEKRKICSVKGSLCVDSKSGEVIETSILKDCFCGNDFDYVRIVIEQGGEAVQTLPSYGSLKLYANENYAKNWFV